MKRERAMMLYSTAKILKADIYLVSAHTPIRLMDNARIQLQIWTCISFFISGEQARSLFIRSKLPLPELSKIWFVRFLIRGKNVFSKL